MNFYSILDESDDEQPKQVKKTPEAKKDAASSGDKKAAKPAGKGAPRKDPPGARPRENKKSAATEPTGNSSATEEDVKKDNNRGGLARGKDNRGKPKTGSKDGKDGKREYDRKSGTGRGREVSRGGRGPFGAGNVKEDAQKAEKDPAAAEVEAEGEIETAEEEAGPPPEPEVPTFTMDQFLAQRAAAREKASSVLAADKARTVDTDFSSGLQKAGEELNDFWAQTKGGKPKKYGKDQRSTGKTSVDVSFKFDTPQQDDDRHDRRGDRGDRGEGGRGRGGRGRGEGRGEGRGRGGRGGRGASFNVSAAEFPTL